MLYETFFGLFFIIFPNYSEHECDRRAADTATDISAGVCSARQPGCNGTLSSFVFMKGKCCMYATICAFLGEVLVGAEHKLWDHMVIRASYSSWFVSG